MHNEINFGKEGIEKFKESYEKVFGMKLLMHKDDKNLDLKSFKFGGKNFKTKIPWTGQGIEMEV